MWASNQKLGLIGDWSIGEWMVSLAYRMRCPERGGEECRWVRSGEIGMRIESRTLVMMVDGDDEAVEDGWDGARWC